MKDLQRGGANCPLGVLQNPSIAGSSARLEPIATPSNRYSEVNRSGGTGHYYRIRSASKSVICFVL